MDYELRAEPLGGRPRGAKTAIRPIPVTQRRAVLKEIVERALDGSPEDQRALLRAGLLLGANGEETS